MTEAAMSGRVVHGSEQIIRDMIDAVWVHGNLDAWGDFWTPDCVNHAAVAGAQVGLVSLRAYHEAFGAQFAAFSNHSVEVVQQVSDGTRVVTHLVTHADHSGDFAGVAATGRRVQLETIRIDRLRDGRISEHWSIAEVAGLIANLRT